VDLLLKIKTFVDLKKKDRLYLFRLFAFLLMLDIIIASFLTRVNPFQIINLFYFLKVPLIDQRSEVMLYFPRAFIIEESDNLIDKALAVKKKVLLKKEADFSDAESYIRENSTVLIHSLFSDPENFRVERVFKNAELLKFVWYRNETVYVHLNRNLWDKYSEKEKKIVQFCISETLLANLSKVTEVVFIFS